MARDPLALLGGQAAPEAFAVPSGRSITITQDYDTGIR